MISVGTSYPGCWRSSLPTSRTCPPELKKSGYRKLEWTEEPCGETALERHFVPLADVQGTAEGGANPEGNPPGGRGPGPPERCASTLCYIALSASEGGRWWRPDVDRGRSCRGQRGHHSRTADRHAHHPQGEERHDDGDHDHLRAPLHPDATE